VPDQHDAVRLLADRLDPPQHLARHGEVEALQLAHSGLRLPACTHEIQGFNRALGGGGEHQPRDQPAPAEIGADQWGCLAAAA
jgi:hypothetical protein